MNKQMLKLVPNQKTKGITLIALVITIIILLILASVSINMIFGENGLIRRAEDSKYATLAGEIKDDISIELASISVDQTNGKEKISGAEKRQRIINKLTDDGMLNNKYVTISDSLIIIGNKYVISLSTGNWAIEAKSDEWNYRLDYIYTYQNYTDTSLKETYSINEDGIDGRTGVVYGYNGTDTDITIPEYVTENGKVYPITRIAQKWDGGFSGKNFKSVTIRDNIRIIEAWEFLQCTNLENVYMGDGVEMLLEGTFANCINLNQIYFSEALKEIPANTFRFDNSLETISIPSNIKEIGKQAFMYVGHADEQTGLGYGSGIPPKLKKIEISEGVEYIGEQAFVEANSVIYDLHLPSTIKTIETGAFDRYGTINNKKVYKYDGTVLN